MIRDLIPVPRTVLPWAVALAAAAALALLAGGCAGSIVLEKQLLAKASEDFKIERVTGFAPPKNTNYLGNLTPETIKFSLQRIVVKYHGVISFSVGKPQPLLSFDQVEAFSAVLVKELPTLAPNQRIRFTFRDVGKRNQNELDVYRDGPYIVYYFNEFVGNPEMALNPGDPPFSEADMDPQTGQEFERAIPNAYILYDPLPGTTVATSANVKAANALIEEQRAKGDIPFEEASRLRAIVEKHPELTIQAWREYWEKRGTLKTARAQGLIDETAYKTQLVKIEQELAP